MTARHLHARHLHGGTPLPAPLTTSTHPIPPAVAA